MTNTPSQLDVTHPSLDQLSDFASGKLDEDTSVKIEMHIADCALCCASMSHLHEKDSLIDQIRDLPITVDWDPHKPIVTQAEEVRPTPVIPGFEILNEVGRGGMGIVYKARQLSLNRWVALKMLLLGDYASAEQRVRFRIEAELAARVQHPNIVQVYEVGIHQGQAYLALEWIDGGTLADLIASRRLSPQEAASLIETIAVAIHTAHCQGVFHRDIKPANILIVQSARQDGTSHHGQAYDYIPKITDFGIAKSVVAKEAITGSGNFLGTPDYLAPEQIAKDSLQPIGPAVDTYALGVCFYELLAGVRPFRGATPWDIVQQVVQQEPPSIRRANPDVPADLEIICLKCLSKKPSQRYPTALALAEDLRRYREGRPIHARATGFIERTWLWAKRHPSLAALVTFAALVAMIGFPLVSALWLQADKQLQRAELAIDAADDLLYFNHVALAQNALDSDNLVRAETMLQRCLPEPNSNDRRDWEWYYLNRLCHADLVPGMSHAGSEAPTHIHDVAWSADGKWLASAAGMPHGLVAGYDPAAFQTVPGEIKIWDVTSAKCVKTIRPERGAMYTAAWHPSGQWLVSGGANGQVSLYDTKEFNSQSLFEAADKASVHCVRFSQDGQYLAVGTPQGIYVWDFEARREVLRSPKPFYQNQSMWFRGGEIPRLYLEAKEPSQRSILAWDFPKNLDPIEVSIPSIPVEHASIVFGEDPDGSLLTISIGPNGTQIWDITTQRLVYQKPINTRDLFALAISKSGWFATGDEDGVLRVWNATERREVFAIRGHHSGILCIAYSPDGKKLVSAGRDGEIKIWNSMEDPRGSATATNPDFMGEHIGAFGFDGNGSLVLIEHQGQHAHYLDPITAIEKSKVFLPNLTKNSNNPRRDQTLSPDGKRFIALDEKDNHVLHVWTFEQPEQQTDLPRCAGRVTSVAWGGEMIAYARLANDEDPSQGCIIHTVEASSLKSIGSWSVPESIIGCLAINFDGSLIAGAAVERDPNKRGPTMPSDIIIWDAKSGQEKLRLQGAVGLIPSIAFRPHAQQLAAAAYHAGELKVWDLQTGKSVFTTTNLLVPTCVNYSPNGRRLVTSGFDNRVRLWDSDYGREVLTLPAITSVGTGDYNFTARATFSPDGHRIAAINWQGSVAIWTAVGNKRLQ